MKCKDISNYIFNLKDEKNNFLRTGQRKTVIWGFVFSIKSIVSITKDLLTHPYKSYSYILTYKFSQDHIELLFSKTRQCCGWNNNPNVLQFKYAWWKLIMRNSIEPSQTGNCTNFDQALCEPSGLLNFTWKHKQQVSNETLQPTVHDITEERLLIHIDDECPNVLKDDILYYIGGFIVCKLIPKIHCKKCKNELFLDPGDPTAVTKESYPVYAKFTCWRQQGGLILPSPAVLRIIKATEVTFRRWVIDNELGINLEKMLHLKIQMSVLHQLGIGIF